METLALLTSIVCATVGVALAAHAALGSKVHQRALARIRDQERGAK